MNSAGKFSTLLIVFFIGASLNACSQGNQNFSSNSPGPEHEYLYLFDGNWRQLFSTVPSVNEEAVFAKGQTNNKLIYGGRFLQMEGELTIKGFLVNSKITIGFDNRIKKYYIFGIDALSTNAIYAKGTFDKENMEFNFNGEDIDSSTMEKIKYRINIKFDGREKYTYAIFIMEKEEEKKKLEIINIKL